MSVNSVVCATHARHVQHGVALQSTYQELQMDIPPAQKPDLSIPRKLKTDRSARLSCSPTMNLPERPACTCMQQGRHVKQPQQCGLLHNDKQSCIETCEVCTAKGNTTVDTSILSQNARAAPAQNLISACPIILAPKWPIVAPSKQYNHQAVHTRFVTLLENDTTSCFCCTQLTTSFSS